MHACPHAPGLHPLPLQIKIILFSGARRQHQAEAAAGPSTQPGAPRADAAGAPEGSRTAPPAQHGAGDAGQRRESAHARKMKMFMIWLLLLDARRHQQGPRAEDGPGGGPGTGSGANAEPASGGSS